MSWEISSDFTTVTVTLREGMVSHDGTPADAHMLKWDVEERRKGWGRSDMPVFGGVDATVNVIDDLTAEITLSKPFANMETKLSLFMLTDPDMYMRDDGAVAEFNQEDKVIGSRAVHADGVRAWIAHVLGEVRRSLGRGFGDDRAGGGHLLR